METTVDREVALAIVRQAYAKQTMCLANVLDPGIGAAFAHVRREDFLGPGPWQMLRAPGLYSPTPEADPVYVYIDRPIGLVPERYINNGQPSLHAMLLKAAGIKEGEHVVHVGAEALADGHRRCGRRADRSSRSRARGRVHQG